MNESNAMSGVDSHSSAGRKRHRPARNISGLYFLAICILFIMVALLCAKNYLLYKAYYETKQGFYTAIQKIQSVSASQRGLARESLDLKNENSSLKEQYEKILIQNNEILKQMAEIKKQNDELAKKNKELVEDNIELQNSIKTAASVGIKPQNFTSFNGISSRSSLDRGKYLGKFLGTAYTPSKEECGNNKGITNSGEPIIPGISIAIDNKYWPFGTVFYIRGLGYAVAMDTGSAIKGKNRFDFAVFDKKFAQALGSRYWDVYLVRMGNGNVKNIEL